MLTYACIAECVSNHLCVRACVRVHSCMWAGVCVYVCMCVRAHVCMGGVGVHNCVCGLCGGRLAEAAVVAAASG